MQKSGKKAKTLKDVEASYLHFKNTIADLRKDLKEKVEVYLKAGPTDQEILELCVVCKDYQIELRFIVHDVMVKMKLPISNRLDVYFETRTILPEKALHK